MNREETKAFIKTLISLYPNFALTDKTVDAWSLCLANYDTQSCLTALKSHTLGEKWPPTVADLVQIIEQARKPEGSDWTSAEALQWVQTLAANYDKMTEEEKQRARLECPKLTKDTLRLVGFNRFLPAPAYQYNGWVAPKNIEPPPIGLFVKIYEGLKSKEIEAKKVSRLSPNEKKFLSEVNAQIDNKLNKLLN